MRTLALLLFTSCAALDSTDAPDSGDTPFPYEMTLTITAPAAFQRIEIAFDGKEPVIQQEPIATSLVYRTFDTVSAGTSSIVVDADDVAGTTHMHGEVLGAMYVDSPYAGSHDGQILHNLDASITMTAVP